MLSSTPIHQGALLIVEDDVPLGASLQTVLNKAGFEAHWVADAEAASDWLKKQTFHAMVLDITLPGLSGLQLLQKMRQEGNTLPVLMLTARDTVQDKVICFETGADDFLIKTTDMEELIARLRALIRRAGYVGRIHVGSLTLDAQTQVVTKDGRLLSLSGREFELLRILMEGVGQVIPRSQLELALFGADWSGESNALEVHVHNLRQKIGETNLKTVRGVGYAIASQIM